MQVACGKWPSLIDPKLQGSIKRMEMTSMATATVCAAASPGLNCCWLGTHPTESAATHTLPSNCLEQKLTYYLYFVAKCSASTLSPGSSTLSLLLTWYFSRIMINSI